MIPLIELLKKSNVTLEQLQVAMLDMKKSKFELTIDKEKDIFLLELENSCYIVARKFQKIETNPDKVYDIISVNPELWEKVSDGLCYFFETLTDDERGAILGRNKWLRKTKLSNAMKENP